MNRLIRPIRFFLLCLTLTALSTGCGGSEDVKLVPAKGKVMFRGRPAANISVQFLPDGMKQNTGPTSYGVTNDKGEFILKTADGREGAVPGHHKVVLADLNMKRVPQGKRPQPGEGSRVRTQYSIAGPKGLSADVKEGSNDEIVISIQ